MELKSVVYKIAEELNRELRPTNIGILNASGSFIASNFSANSHTLISKIVQQYAAIPINNYIKQDLPNSNYFLYIYKISPDVFIVCISDTPENLVLKKFGQIARDYGALLLEVLQPSPPEPKKVPQDDRIVAIVYSKAGDLGPSAVSWMPKPLSDQLVFEIAAKSLLILSAGFDRTVALRESSSVLPFPQGIGMVYVFSIPDNRARGKSYDAAFTLLLKEEYRKALLERLDLFEKGANKLADRIREGGQPDSLIEQFYEYVSNSLNKKVEAFTSPQAQTVIPSDQILKNAMVDEVKRIQVEHPKSLDLDFSHKVKK
ncbi:MAG TPA: hypothetical protein VMV49_06805 [Candidatus Deferrimicrobium sp.]|nr:hypothetical protein [Candidatus Deferrimicrobium sp.]